MYGNLRELEDSFDLVRRLMESMDDKVHQIKNELAGDYASILYMSEKLDIIEEQVALVKHELQKANE